MIKNEDFLKVTGLARDYPKDNFALFYGEFKINLILFTFSHGIHIFMDFG